MRFSHRLILLYLAHAKLAKKKMGVKRKHSRYRKDFFRLIALILSPWRKLLASRNDQAYIIMMGFDCKSSENILDKVAPMFSGHTL